MTAGPTPNKFAIAVAAAVWLVHGLAIGAVSGLHLVLALAIITALLWPEPVPGRETLDPLPRVLAPPSPSSDGWPKGYAHEPDGRGFHSWRCEDGRAGSGLASREAARLGAWRDHAKCVRDVTDRRG